MQGGQVWRQGIPKQVRDEEGDTPQPAKSSREDNEPLRLPANESPDRTDPQEFVPLLDDPANVGPATETSRGDDPLGGKAIQAFFEAYGETPDEWVWTPPAADHSPNEILTNQGPRGGAANRAGARGAPLTWNRCFAAGAIGLVGLPLFRPPDREPGWRKDRCR
jgi:hypothetical protein